MRLSQAALSVNEDAACSEALLRMAEDHQAGLAAHLEDAGFCTILRQFHDFLDFFEKELGAEGRVGVWLGGASFSTADIALGEV